MNNTNRSFKRVLSLFVAVGAANFISVAQTTQAEQLPYQQPLFNYVWTPTADTDALPADNVGTTYHPILPIESGYDVIVHDATYHNYDNLAQNKGDYMLTVESATPGSTVLKFDMLGYTERTIETNVGPGQYIEMAGAHRMLIKGAPDLPQITTPIIIDNTGNTVVEYLDVQYTDYAGVEIVPSKGNLKRTVDPADVPYWKGPQYSKDDFFPSVNASLGQPYIMRDKRGQALQIHRFQYNPVTKVLRVLTSIKVKIVNTGGTGVNELTSTQKHPDTEFTEIYKNHFVNFTAEKTAPMSEIGSMLIIADPAYMTAMQPFVDWKIRKGIPTEMVSVATVGNTTTAIKTYISNYYTNNNLKYVLLVGDLAQVTSPTLSGGKSDPSYGYITGSDSYGEVIVGRFSADSLVHVQRQVTKVLTYEITPPMGNTRFDHQTNIASNQGPGDNNEMDWEHERLIRNKLTTYGYVDYNEYYDGSHQSGGNDAAGDPSAANIVAEVNAGTGIINYTGHGSSVSWGTSGFSNTNIKTLTNTSIWPFIWSVGCVNGEFNNGTCFGEAWLWADHGGVPAGAIATFMSSINQSWDPPMAGQDGMVDIVVGTLDPASIYSFGGISTNGCYYMNDVYGAAGDEMTNTWHCFGDPSIIVRTKDPVQLTASHTPTTPIGTTALAITCNTEGALVAITQNNVILGTAYVSGGVANVTITPVSLTDTLRVTATAFNTMPYLGNILVTSNTGPFVVLQSTQLIDNSPGNNDGLADYGEGISVNVALHNAGDLQATNVLVKLRSTDPNITITDSTYTASLVLPQSSTTLAPAFAFTVSSSVADQTLANFDVVLTDGITTWTSFMSIMLNAPVLSVPAYTIDDTNGNNNGRVDAGETVTINFTNLNSGHSATTTATGTLACNDNMISIPTNTDNAGVLVPNANSSTSYTFTADASIPVNSYVTFNYGVAAGAYTAQFNPLVKVNMLVEDLETGDFNAHDWAQAGDSPWTIDNSVKYEGAYSSRSGVITHGQSSTMTLALNVLTNDSIAFFKKVSSEQDWDFLKFYIDGTQMGSWSGLFDWERVSFPVTTGQHTFTWTYAKDEAYTENADAAWVDFVELPNSEGVTGVAENTVNAGKLSVYPNPANGQITLLVDTKTNTAATLQVYNSLGQIVMAETIPAGQKIYNTSVAGFANGLYTVVVRSSNSMLSSRLMVK